MLRVLHVQIHDVCCSNRELVRFPRRQQTLDKDAHRSVVRCAQGTFPGLANWRGSHPSIENAIAFWIASRIMSDRSKQNMGPLVTFLWSRQGPLILCSRRAPFDLPEPEAELLAGCRLDIHKWDLNFSFGRVCKYDFNM